MKYYDGPWKAVDRTVSQPGFGRIIAECGQSTSIELDQANARLIAAAPEMLEALKEAVKGWESWIHDQLDGTSLLEEALAELKPIKDVIVKAEGKS